MSFIKPALFSLIALISIFFSNKVRAQDFNWLEEHLYPINEISPEKDDFADLLPFKHAVGNARIVMLGEHTHGEGNEFAAKLRLVEFLHQEMGFDMIAFESGFYDLWKANQMIKQGKNVEEVLQSTLFPIWSQSEQFHPFFKYVEEYRGELEIAGFDNQLSGEIATDYLAEDLQIFLKRNQVEIDNDAFDRFEMLIEVLSTYRLPEDFDLKAFKAFKDRIINSLSLIKQNKADSINAAFWIQNLESLYRLCEDYHLNNSSGVTKEKWSASVSNPRDKQMADNILFLSQAYPDKKIICWGASGHLANRVQALDNEELQNYYPAGQHVKEKIGSENVYTIGFITSGGEYGIIYDEPQSVPEVEKGSLEFYLNSEQLKSAYIDFSQLKEEYSFTTSAFSYTPVDGIWQKVFDGMIYLDKVSPSVSFKQRNDQAEASSVQSVRGSVTDQSTGETIPYAHLSIEGTGIGSVSNEQGEFELKVPLSLDDFSLQVSAIGYETSSLSSEDINNENLQIILKPSIAVLDAVTITTQPESPEELVMRVIKNIPDNYTAKALKYTFYYKGEEYADKASVKQYREAAIEAYYSKGYAEGSKKQFSVINKRVTQLKDSKSESFIMNWPWFGLNSEVANRSDILDKNSLKVYELQITDTLYNDVSAIYVLSYKCLKPRKKYTGFAGVKSLVGKLFIQAEDYAVLKQQKSITFNHKGKDDLSPHRFEFEVQYKKKNNQYFLAFSEFNSLHQIQSGKEANHFVHGLHRLMTAKIDINEPEALNEWVYDIDKAPYDQSFWNSFNTIYSKD